MKTALKETTLQNNRSGVVFLNGESWDNATYLKETTNMHSNNEIKRYSNIYKENITEQFKTMQNSIMQEQIPILTKLLMETDFDSGYESMAEIYFNALFEKYGIIADTILQNIYLQNMYDKQHLLKHLLFIVANLPSHRRSNLEIIPLAGISNPDNEIQDLSVKCFEAWEDKRHIPTLINLREKTTIGWFKAYISDVIEALEEG